jgi:hypothetical protein
VFWWLASWPLKEHFHTIVVCLLITRVILTVCQVHVGVFDEKHKTVVEPSKVKRSKTMFLRLGSLYVCVGTRTINMVSTLGGCGNSDKYTKPKLQPLNLPIHGVRGPHISICYKNCRGGIFEHRNFRPKSLASKSWVAPKWFSP